MTEKLYPIIKHYGVGNQIDKSIEEMHELEEALKRRDPKEHIAEEIADNIIMLQQLMLIFGLDQEDIQSIIDFKLTRTKFRMEKEKKTWQME